MGRCPLPLWAQRASFLLHERRYNIDALWNLLKKYLANNVRPETSVADEQLQGVIEYVRSHLWIGGAA